MYPERNILGKIYIYIYNITLKILRMTMKNSEQWNSLIGEIK